MDSVPAQLVQECVHDMRNCIGAMRNAFVSIQAVVGDHPELESILALVERQFVVFNQLADKMNKEAELPPVV